MSRPVGNCPQCGAKIEFRWSGAVQTTCEFCQSILIRTDFDLQKVGKMADLPADASPIQINAEGIWQNKAFTVVGRIVYDFFQGSWNEWHLLFQDGTSGTVVWRRISHKDEIDYLVRKVDGEGAATEAWVPEEALTAQGQGAQVQGASY